MEMLELYESIQQYAKEKHYENTLQAVISVYKDMYHETKDNRSIRFNSALHHALEVCHMLLDLHPALSDREMDILLAASLLHVYPEYIKTEEFNDTYMFQIEFDSEVYGTVDALYLEKGMMDFEMEAAYQKVKDNKLALLIALADRGNMIQHIYEYSSWHAHSILSETKTYYYPMAIYAKQYYHELLKTVNVLIEKMRTLLEVAEIFLKKYEVREQELMQDILALQEENATIRGIISHLKGES